MIKFSCISINASDLNLLPVKDLKSCCFFFFTSIQCNVNLTKTSRNVWWIFTFLSEFSLYHLLGFILHCNHLYPISGYYVWIHLVCKTHFSVPTSILVRLYSFSNINRMVSHKNFTSYLTSFQPQELWNTGLNSVSCNISIIYLSPDGNCMGQTKSRSYRTSIPLIKSSVPPQHFLLLMSSCIHGIHPYSMLVWCPASICSPWQLPVKYPRLNKWPKPVKLSQGHWWSPEVSYCLLRGRAGRFCPVDHWWKKLDSWEKKKKEINSTIWKIQEQSNVLAVLLETSSLLFRHKDAREFLAPHNLSLL